MLLRLAERIRYTAAPIGDILCELAACEGFADFSVLTDTARLVGEDGEFRSAWRQAVRIQQDRLAFTQEELTLMTEAVVLLGDGDALSEMRHCEQYAARLHTCVQRRSEDKRVRGRLYTALGLCGGCAVGLLLL